MKEYYKILGLSPSASDDEIEFEYKRLKEKYSRERFCEGEVGNEAAKNLTKLETAYNEIMASRKVKGATQAVKLVNNAEKVSNICADVIGDICGIISGSCSATIVIMFASNNPNEYIFNILMSSVVAAITVGGKAFFKKIAIKKSKDIMLLAGKIISIFSKKTKS